MSFITINNNKNIYGCKKHSHEFYEIIIQADGKCITHTKDKDYNLEKGSIILLPTNTEHENSSDTPFEDIYIQADSLPFVLNHTKVIFDYSLNIADMARLLYSLHIKNDSSYKKSAYYLASSIFELIAVLLNEKYRYSFTAKLKNILEMNISDCNFSLPEIIHSLGYNLDYIRKGFKYDIGVTPLEYLTQLRINHAKELLINADFKSIYEIAYSCGFNDPYYFSRLFKKNTGYSPKEYRNKKLTY